MNVINEPGQRVPIYAWTDGVLFEDEARRQVENVAKLPFVYKHVAIMPDVHAGIGATVGSVVATKGAIIPAAVGVDIGCGMVAAKTPLRASDLPDNLLPLRLAIEAAVPHGRTDGGGDNDRGAWHDVPRPVMNAWYGGAYGIGGLLEGYDKIIAQNNGVGHRKPMQQLCSLGTGNHFIEICLDENDDVWAMLHSGSRGVGNRIGSYFIELARKDMERYFINLPDKDLAYLPQGSQHYGEYMEAVAWAQKYARINRELMLSFVLSALSQVVKPFDHQAVTVDAINCHHNYVNEEKHFGQKVLVTRKGAIRARTTDLGIIPGSMGTRSYIVRGRGSRDSFESASHGAGRVMSRTRARHTFTVGDHALAMKGVEGRLDEGVLDETPGAYKDIDAVLAAEQDLVEVVHTLKQVVVVKG